MTATVDTVAPEETAAAETVSVDIDQLIVGRPIKFPIHDEKGVLLLADGAVITSDFKRLLRKRNVTEVNVDARDVDQVTLSVAVEAADSFSFDTELTSHLDRIIDGGMIPVRNSGPAIQDEMVFLGKKAYDQEQRDRLVEQNNTSQQAIASVMRSALHGDSVDATAMTQMTGKYVTEMQKDVDSVLTSSLGVFDDDNLSAQALQTSLLSMALGIEMGFDADNVRMLGLIGMVHDWGMMKVPKAVREAGHPLSANDFHEIKKHPIHSLEMLQNASGMPGLVSLVSYQIHERPNGNGYPRGRAGKSIHQFARIVAVADAYTAMTSGRTWRQPYMAYAAVECLLRDAQKRKIDSNVVRALLSILSLFPIGSLVTLNDGSIARVMRRNGSKYMTPIVQLIQNGNGEPVDPMRPESVLDLSEEAELKVEQALPSPGRKELGLTAALTYQELESTVVREEDA